MHGVTPTASTRAWAQVPPRPAAGPGAGHRLAADRRVRWALAVAVGALGQFLRALAIAPAPAPVVVAAAGLVGAVAVGSIDLRRWPLRLVAAAIAGAATVPSAGASAAVWLALGLVLADWAVRDRPPLPVLAPAPEALAPVIVLEVVAALRGRSLFSTVAPIAITVAALAVTWASSRWGGRLSNLAARIGRAAAAAVSALVFGLLGIVVVVVPWLVHRLFGLDPVRAGSPGRWIARGRADTRPDRPWTVDAATVAPSRWYRLRQRLSTVVVLVVIATITWVSTRTVDRGLTALAEDAPAVFQGRDWWPEYHEAEHWALFDPGPAANALRYPPTFDISSRYLNVDGGERRTWRPGPCSCRRLRVWVYGGSTVFGLGQRDGHTIPSELARLAAREGLVLDVSNRGVLGDLGWEAAQRFAWDAAAEPAPDAVVFYDGYNDLAAAVYFNDRGRGSEEWPIDWTAESFEEDARWWPVVDLPWEHPDGVEVADRPRHEPQRAAQLGAAAAKRYETGRLAAAAVAERTGVDAHWFWQPDRFTRPPTEGEPQQRDTEERFQRRARAAVTPELAPGVVDLRDLFDDVEGPIFYDDVHTGERGARLVAAALLDELRPGLTRRADRQDEP